MAVLVTVQVMLSAAAGVLVDRWDVRIALIVPNLVRTVLMLGLALAGANVALLLALNLGISLTTVVLTPAEASMIPRIVPKAQLETAMGVFNITLQASFAVGFAFLGPLLVALAGPSFVLAVVTVFYAAATFVTFGLPSAPPLEKEHATSRNVVAEPVRQAREGFAAISGDREVGRPLVHLAAAASLVGVIGVLAAASGSALTLKRGATGMPFLTCSFIAAGEAIHQPAFDRPEAGRRFEGAEAARAPVRSRRAGRRAEISDSHGTTRSHSTGHSGPACRNAPGCRRGRTSWNRPSE